MNKIIKTLLVIVIVSAIIGSFCLKKWYLKNDSKFFESLPLCLINVLDKEEFEDAHITGSINIPYHEIEKTLKLIPHNKKVIFYCANYLCTASSEAAKSAVRQGFKNVYTYEGGMAEWYQINLNDKSYTYKGPAQLSYLQVIIPQPEYKEEEHELEDFSGKYINLTAEELKNIIRENNLN